MNPPQHGRPSTEAYMIKECDGVITKFQAIPDVACMMLSKICKMLIACITTFQNSDDTKAPWTRLFEGSEGLCWNLQTTPTHEVLMGLFSQLQYLPSHMMLAFEETFYTGFFEQA